MRSWLVSLILVCVMFAACSKLFISCSKDIQMPKLDVSSIKAETAKAAWARILKNYVDERGRVDFVGVEKNRADLDLYVAFVSAHPSYRDAGNFSSKNEQIAESINAYNALSMYNVIHYGIPKDIDSFFKRMRFFFSSKFVIGGEKMSLYTFENDIIRKFGDPRVHFALNCMSGGCPRLPQVPFVGDKFDDQANAAAKEFFQEERHVQVDTAKSIVRFSEILKFFTEDFLSVSPSLIAYANIYREEKIDEGLKVKFIPYDWNIASQ